MSRSPRRPRVVLMRGYQANSWHLRPWIHLSDRFDVMLLETQRNWFDTGAVELERVPVRTIRDWLPRGRIGDLAVRLPGDRYLGLEEKLRGADVVHSQDLVFWYSAQAARLKPKLGFKLVLTVWETIPFLAAYRNVRTRPYREDVLKATDLFLCATERAKATLLLEGAPEERIAVCAPGVDDKLFRSAASSERPQEHVVVSPGRLVWEKGHQDVLRAVAAIRNGVMPKGAAHDVRVLVIGSGPEERRLRRHAAELGLGAAIEFRSSVPYAEMPHVYERASCVVLASLPTWFWEEQFGMVLAEAMTAGLPIIASTSGAIPEVLRGQAALFAPGDWLGLAKALLDGPLARQPGERVAYDPSVVGEYESVAAARRLAVAYDRILGR